MMRVSMYSIVYAFFFVNIVNALSFGNSKGLVIHSVGLTVLHTSGIYLFIFKFLKLPVDSSSHRNISSSFPFLSPQMTRRFLV